MTTLCRGCGADVEQSGDVHASDCPEFARQLAAARSGGQPPAAPDRRAAVLARLRELRNGDPEGGHIEADELLLDLIADDEIREAFEAIRKWYA